MRLLPTLLSTVALAGGEPRLSAPSGPIDTGTAATFAFATSDAAAFVDGCAPIELERREGDAWVAVGGTVVCDGSQPARRVDGSLAMSVGTPGPGEFRGVAAWGTGCVEGRAFALAACARVGVVRSASFVVQAPAPPPR